MAAPLGSQKFAVLLCQFKDTAQAELHPRSFYEELFRRGTGGINDYWLAASHGKINLDGAEIFGWKALGQTRAEYVASHVSRWDKIQGAIDAFQIDADQYFGVIAMFNSDVEDAGASGKGVLVNSDVHNTTFLAHETGHVFGLGHSFDQSNRKLISWSAPGEYYDNHDIMSAMNVYHHPHTRFGPSGPLLSAAFMDFQGWLDAGRVWTPPHSGSTSDAFDLVSMGHPQVQGYLAAKLGSLYVEFRTNDGWDQGLPRATVLIHRLTGNTAVAMTTGTGLSPLAGGSGWEHEWLPGELFESTSAIQAYFGGGTWVSVESFDLQAKKARIRIRHQMARPPIVEQGPIRLGRDGVDGNGILIMPNGRVVIVPPRSLVIRGLFALTAFAVRVRESFAVWR